MKKLSKILCVSATVIAMMFSMTCNTNAQMGGSKFSKSKNIEIELFDNEIIIEYPLKFNEKTKKLLADDKNNKQKAVGKYSDFTPDKKMNWSRASYYAKGDIPDHFGNYKKKTLNMMKKLTLGAKKVSLPTTFDALGKEYKDFKHVDYLKLTKDMEEITIKNLKNGYFAQARIGDLRSDKSEKRKDYDIYMDMYSKDNFLFGFTMDARDKRIVALESSGRGLYPGGEELKVDNIGVGNTFNEMYAKFGEPSYSYSNEILRGAEYECIDNKGKRYIISFKRCYYWNGENYYYPKANVISSVNVSVY
jgi:hypothetical protein